MNVVGIGEVLWDLLPGGARLGGAPANFAFHAAALGASATVVSRVGDDERGRAALRQMAGHGLDVSACTVDPHLPTGVVDVEVGPDGSPRFRIAPVSAWDALEAGTKALAAAAGADAVCFGTLGQRTAAGSDAVCAIVAASKPESLRIFDINLRAPHFSAGVIERSLRLANVLKLNEGEAPVLKEQFALRGSVEEQLATLARRFDLKVIALTLGAAGSKLCLGGEWTAAGARPVRVVDAVGAGDAFTAAMALGLFRGWSPGRILAAANETAAFVCTQAGATPAPPPELAAVFDSESTP
jgi:fructokinase